MRITSSYGVEIRKADGALSATLKVYREAVRVLALFYDSVWEEASSVAGEKKRFNYAEHLVHGTKRNRAVHDFDSRFPKMPSYLPYQGDFLDYLQLEGMGVFTTNGYDPGVSGAKLEELRAFGASLK